MVLYVCPKMPGEDESIRESVRSWPKIQTGHRQRQWESESTAAIPSETPTPGWAVWTVRCRTGEGCKVTILTGQGQLDRTGLLGRAGSSWACRRLGFPGEGLTERRWCDAKFLFPGPRRVRKVSCRHGGMPGEESGSWLEGVGLVLARNGEHGLGDVWPGDRQINSGRRTCPLQQAGKTRGGVTAQIESHREGRKQKGEGGRAAGAGCGRRTRKNPSPRWNEAQARTRMMKWGSRRVGI